ncbi:hypothetical protein ACLB2K_052791 [Fragaria x ananassa]
MIFRHSRWIIGDGKSILFWSDKWLDSSILDKLQVSHFPKPLTTIVASYISGQQWNLPHRFSVLFPGLFEDIQHCPLPIVPDDDLLIWEESSNGLFSFSEGYNLVLPHYASNNLHAKVWQNFIPPRFSILVWRLLHNRLPTDDQLQRRGIPLVSVCQLCSFCSVEDSTHVFVNYSFAQHVWQWLSSCFGTSLPSQSSLDNLWSVIVGKSFSPQLKNVWLTGCLFAFRAIWRTCIMLCFDNKKPSLMRVIRSIKSWLRFVAPHFPGYSCGVVDSQLLLSLGVQPVSRKVVAPRLVLWHSSVFPWIKLNTDGLAKGNPGPVACSGAFRVANGHYIGGYYLGLGQQSAFFSELMGVIIGIEIAFQMGWHCLWLECDSTSVLACIASSSFAPPWPLRIAWLNCLSHIRLMTFHCIQVLREGNSIVDRLANLGLTSSILIWHASPPEIFPYLRMDAQGSPYSHAKDCFGFPVSLFLFHK